MELICTACDGLGERRYEVTHPEMNVHGLHRIRGHVWGQSCERCAATGFVISGHSGVPIVPAAARRIPPSSN